MEFQELHSFVSFSVMMKTVRELSARFVDMLKKSLTRYDYIAVVA